MRIYESKEKCTGCGACVAICPAQCLSMREDDEGFRYPYYVTDECVHCGKCMKVCHYRQDTKYSGAEVYYAGYLKEKRELMTVSSGGASWALIKYIIRNGGIAYGAVQDEVGMIHHHRADRIEEAVQFKRSKYLPSNMEDMFTLVEDDLKKGGMVLFTGVPCQVAAIRTYLGKEYDRFYTCDVVCHGIPSVKVFRQYRKETEEKYQSTLIDINCRNKEAGWKQNQYELSFKNGNIVTEKSQENPFHRGYTAGLYYRPSCGNCKYSCLPRSSDITLADYWRYQGRLLMNNQNGGISLIVINTEKGREMFSAAKEDLFIDASDRETAIDSCRHLTKKPLVHPKRNDFFLEFEKDSFEKALQKSLRDSFMKKMYIRTRDFYNLYKKKMKEKEHELTLTETIDRLIHQNIKVFFFDRIGEPDVGFEFAESAKRRMDQHTSFPIMLQDPDAYRDDFMELLGNKYSAQYVEELSRIPQIILKGDKYKHEDIQSKLINITLGLRETEYIPENSEHFIHFYGRCGVFGYAVEDSDTLPSQLQKILNEKKYSYRVINHGLWGAENAQIDHNFFMDSESFHAGDVIIFYRKNYHESLMKKLIRKGMIFKRLEQDFYAYPESRWCFYDKPGHLNRDGYRIVAHLVMECLEASDFTALNKTVRPGKKVFLRRFLKMHENTALKKEIDQYSERILQKLPKLGENAVCGAVVMNCNPFTNGHRYLVEYASKKVDRLYIFVVQEDRSFFRFEDRYEMVKEGTADIQNVVVAPSGKFMISALTFPQYFMKDYVKNKNFDVTGDLELFCEEIAPRFHIQVRFAGEEPTDPVTAHYNENMKRILPLYGLSFCEIPRLMINNEDQMKPLSATSVRELLKKDSISLLKEYVPENTYEIIINKYRSIDGGIQET